MFTELSAVISVTSNALHDPLEAAYRDIVAASGKAAVRALPQRTMRAAAPEIKGFKFDATNPSAVEWIREHAASTITGISETTREAVKDLVEAAFEEQFDVDDLADAISEELGGDPDRAENIARTETMLASNRGQQLAWDQAIEAGWLTGEEQQEWITTPDDRLCPICEPLDGQTVPLGGQFKVDGDRIDGPPAHPRCRCTVGLTA